MSQKPLIIIQLGKPPQDVVEIHGEQSDWMKRAIGDDSITVIRPHDGDELPAPHLIGGAVLTGSWSMVTDRDPWSELTAEWIRSAMQVKAPLLGICYGHQLMADALGGRVGFHPGGREIGQHEITLHPQAMSDALLSRYPLGFIANLTHEQSVLEPPAQATVLGSSNHDAYQILRYSPEALSVQFHPEFNVALMTTCLSRRQDVFQAEGFDVQALIETLDTTHAAQDILVAFARECQASSLEHGETVC